MLKSVKLVMLIVLFVLVGVLEAEFIIEPRNVLVLHSYSPSMTWVDEMSGGINEVTSSERSMQIEIFYEFLEAKKFNSELYFYHTAEALRFKYENIKFQVIISCDDHAIDFLSKYRDLCFPDVAVIYCGVNNPGEKDYSDYDDIKGILELNPLEQNIDLIGKLIPETEEILIVIDSNTKTNNIYRNRIQSEISGKNDGVRIRLTDNLSFDDLEESLSGLPQTTVVFYFSYIVDARGQYLPHISAAKRVLRRCNRPIFTMNRIYLQLNVVGGYVTDPREHGKAAALMALDYLRGVAMENITARDYYNWRLYPAVFNHTQLNEYSISTRNLPEDAIIEDFAELERCNQEKKLKTLYTILFIAILLLLYLIYNAIRISRIKTKSAARSASRESEIERIPAGIIRLDKTGRYMEINEYACRIMGKKKEDILGYTGREAGLCREVYENDEHLIRSDIQDKEGRKIFEIDNREQDKKIICELHYTAEYKEGELQFVTELVHDITEDFFKYKEVKDKLSVCKSILANSPIGLGIIQPVADKMDTIWGLQIVMANRILCEIWGIEPSQPDEFRMLENSTKNLKLFSEKIGDFWLEENSEADFKEIAENGRYFNVTARKTKGELIVITYSDITNYYEQQHNLEELNKKLDSMLKSRDLEAARMKKQIEIKDELLIEQSQSALIGEILSSISNNLYKPLQNITEAVIVELQKLLCGSEKPEEINEKLQLLMDDIIKMRMTIYSIVVMLDRQLPGCKQDIGEIVRKSVALIEESFREEGIKISLKLEEGCYYYGKEFDYAQVIINLLNNSREAIRTNSQENGEIRIELIKEDNNCLMRVGDNAGGIPVEYHQKIFDPFFTTKLSPGGAGMGLYICRKIIEEDLKGKITISNIEGGIEFMIETRQCGM
jgi:PAS domain S-box-containing protein